MSDDEEDLATTEPFLRRLKQTLGFGFAGKKDGLDDPKLTYLGGTPTMDEEEAPAGRRRIRPSQLYDGVDGRVFTSDLETYEIPDEEIPTTATTEPQQFKHGGVYEPETPRGRRRSWRWLWITMLLLLLGGGAWFAWPHLPASVRQRVKVASGGGSSGEVIVLIQPTPKRARVYVNGQLTNKRSLQLPRSDEPIEVRVVAPGYDPATHYVVPYDSRIVKIKLVKSP